MALDACQHAAQAHQGGFRQGIGLGVGGAVDVGVHIGVADGHVQQAQAQFLVEDAHQL